MKHHNVIAISALAVALAAGNACAQGTKVGPAQVFFDEAFEVTLPANNTFQIKLDGLKSVRAVWITFAGYPGGKPPRLPQVITLMEGVTARWGAPDEGCTYELKLADGGAPVINMKKAAAVCTLRDGEKAKFRILAM